MVCAYNGQLISAYILLLEGFFWYKYAEKSVEKWASLLDN